MDDFGEGRTESLGGWTWESLEDVGLLDFVEIGLGRVLLSPGNTSVVGVFCLWYSLV